MYRAECIAIPDRNSWSSLRCLVRSGLGLARLGLVRQLTLTRYRNRSWTRRVVVRVEALVVVSLWTVDCGMFAIVWPSEEHFAALLLLLLCFCFLANEKPTESSSKQIDTITASGPKQMEY